MRLAIYDNIEGARAALVEATRNAPDVIVGEEVPAGIGVILFRRIAASTVSPEALHRDIQPLRRNVVDGYCLPAESRRVLLPESPSCISGRSTSRWIYICSC